VFTIPNELDLVIMSPPFTRATGRTESYGEGSESRGLFGFIVNVTQKRNFDQTRHYTPRLTITLTPCPPNFCEIFIKGDA